LFQASAVRAGPAWPIATGEGAAALKCPLAPRSGTDPYPPRSLWRRSHGSGSSGRQYDLVLPCAGAIQALTPPYAPSRWEAVAGSYCVGMAILVGVQVSGRGIGALTDTDEPDEPLAVVLDRDRQTHTPDVADVARAASCTNFRDSQEPLERPACEGRSDTTAASYVTAPRLLARGSRRLACARGRCSGAPSGGHPSQPVAEDLSEFTRTTGRTRTADLVQGQPEQAPRRTRQRGVSSQRRLSRRGSVRPARRPGSGSVNPIPDDSAYTDGEFP